MLKDLGEYRPSLVTRHCPRGGKGHSESHVLRKHCWQPKWWEKLWTGSNYWISRDTVVQTQPQALVRRSLLAILKYNVYYILNSSLFYWVSASTSQLLALNVLPMILNLHCQFRTTIYKILFLFLLFSTVLLRVWMSTVHKVNHYERVTGKESLSARRSMYSRCQLPGKRQCTYYTKNIISIAALYNHLSDDSKEYHACQDVNYQTAWKSLI